MRALVIDDERLARKELINLLSQFDHVEVVGEANNVDDAKEKIETLSPDVVFLDIQMPEKTGFDLLEELDTVPHVIFTTAYDEYAMKAFQVNALDYLLKPVEPKRLGEAIERLQKKLSEASERHEDASFAHQNKKLTLDDQVFVKDGDRCWFVKLAEIRLFDSVGNYAKVYFSTNKPLILKSLNSFSLKKFFSFGNTEDFFPEEAIQDSIKIYTKIYKILYIFLLTKSFNQVVE
jgi:two-component system LytT family response regulator